MVARELVFRVDAAAAGQRLDKLVVSRVPGLGRRGAATLFQHGAVRVGHRVASKGELAVAGSEIRVELEADAQPLAEPNATLMVRLETARILVVDKPAGQPTAPLGASESGTLAGALLGRYPELAGVGYRAREPGLLHRLDTQTSGLVVVARDADAFERLRAALVAGRLDKRYLAVVGSANVPESGVVNEPVEPDPRDPKRVRAGQGGRRRSTRFRVVRRGPEWTLIELSVSRAYRHQIRAHLAFIGHPIAGDALYGGAPVAALGARHALHASYVAWSGDDSVEAFAVESRLPAELELLLG